MSPIQARDLTVEKGKYLCLRPDGEVKPYNATVVQLGPWILWVLLSVAVSLSDLFSDRGAVILVETVILLGLVIRWRYRRHKEKTGQAVGQQQVQQF